MFVRRDDPDDVRLETVGRPVCPDDEVRLVDDDDNVVPDGEVGELCARGPYTLRGYYGVPEYNARAVLRRRLLPLRRSDAPAPIRATTWSRAEEDLINRGGEKISAEEIENLILSHPAVQNVACIAVPDPDLGERMCACIILRDGMRITSRSSRRSCGKEIAGSSCRSGWSS